MIGVSIHSARNGIGLLGMVVLLAASGCRKDEDKDKDKTADPDTKTATAGSAKKGAKAPKDEGIDVPTEEDFEATVEAQITAETDLKKELDEIEKQIGQ
jgi:hypothetical protein